MDRSIPLRQILQAGVGLGSLSMAAVLAERGGPYDPPMAIAGGLAGLACMAHAALGNRAKRPRPVADGLDRVLLHWDEDNAFTLRDLLNGGVAIFGRTGSGKTSSSGKALAHAIASLPGSGGLIIAAKPGEDRAMWQRIFAAAGRSDDLLIFSPEHPLRFNLLDYECRNGGITRNITKCLMVIAENLRSGEQDNSGDSVFWRRESERMLFNCIEIVKLATGKVSAPDLHRFLNGAAMHPQQLHTDEWLASFHNQCLKAAWQKTKSPMEQHDFELSKEYFLGELPNMADKTRSSIMVQVLGLLHTMNQGIVRELLSTTTNVTPDDMFQGRWLLLDMPVSDYAETGAFVNGSIKYMTQKAILRRVVDGAAPPVVIWGDEGHSLVTTEDAHCLAQCRSHRGCMVYLSQSLPGYMAALGGEKGRHSVDALLTNFHTKVFHALGDLETANWASGLVGRSLQVFTGGSITPGGGVYDEVMGRSRYSGNYSQSFESTLQANAFLHGLRTGGEANGLICDAYVIRSGEPFASGENWIRVSFSQKGAGA